MRSFGRLISACLLWAAIATFIPIAAADPTEMDSDLVARDEDYAAGKQAVDEKHWGEAVRFFQRAELRHPDDANLAFKHYRRAIDLDPRNRGAHEYIGEAYLMTGDLAAAEKHLAALKEICLLPCEELQDLENAIAGYRKRK